jgi:hypothetical protein
MTENEFKLAAFAASLQKGCHHEIKSDVDTRLRAMQADLKRWVVGCRGGRQGRGVFAKKVKVGKTTVKKSELNDWIRKTSDCLTDFLKDSPKTSVWNW